MKLVIECLVESNIRLGSELSIEKEGKLFTFLVNSEGALEKIKVLTPISYPERFYSEVKTNSPSPSQHEIILRKDDDLIDSVIEELQSLESSLAFTYQVRKFHWNTLQIDLVCETTEERNRNSVVSLKMESRYPEYPVIVSDEDMRSLVLGLEKYKSLSIYKSFYREGHNDFTSFRYINAFYNYYFILEGMFSGGETRNTKVEQEFYKSEILTRHVQELIQILEKKHPRHLKNIKKMLDKRNQELSVKGIISLIVKVRGDLHHFFNNKNKIEPTPFNQKAFESIALVMLFLSCSSILGRVVEINQEKNI